MNPSPPAPVSIDPDVHVRGIGGVGLDISRLRRHPRVDFGPVLVPHLAIVQLIVGHDDAGVEALGRGALNVDLERGVSTATSVGAAALRKGPQGASFAN